MHEQVFWLDRQGLLDRKLVTRVVQVEVKVLQEKNCCEECFLPGKRSANTGPNSIAERLGETSAKVPVWRAEPTGYTFHAFFGNF